MRGLVCRLAPKKRAKNFISCCLAIFFAASGEQRAGARSGVPFGAGARGLVCRFEGFEIFENATQKKRSKIFLAASGQFSGERA